jgi:hypothetical protein
MEALFHDYQRNRSHLIWNLTSIQTIAALVSHTKREREREKERERSLGTNSRDAGEEGAGGGAGGAGGGLKGRSRHLEALAELFASELPKSYSSGLADFQDL